MACGAILAMQPACAFDSPLSEEAVREAYFLGQRHDESLTKFIDKYIRYLPVPHSGPQIASVSVYTPFVQEVLRSSNHVGSYSAQQAQLDHRAQPELVRVRVIIRVTDSYPAMVPANPGISGADGSALVRRSSDFWRDFDVKVFDGRRHLAPSSTTGRPDYNCWEGGCALTGATMWLDFPASAFSSQDVSVQVDPPEGDQVSTNFDLSLLR